jgi:hypothetical protein
MARIFNSVYKLAVGTCKKSSRNVKYLVIWHGIEDIFEKEYEVKNVSRNINHKYPEGNK